MSWKSFDADGYPPEGRQYIAGRVCTMSSSLPEENGKLIWDVEFCDDGKDADMEEYPFWMLIPKPKKSQL